MLGTLHLVATPIGNLADITERAVAVLRAVSHVVAEDTRHTRGLLSHLGITGKQLHALDANASERAIERVVALLKAGSAFYAPASSAIARTGRPAKRAASGSTDSGPPRTS